VTDLVTDNATDFTKVGAGILGLYVLTALGSKDYVTTDLAHLIRCLVLWWLHTDNTGTWCYQSEALGQHNPPPRCLLYHTVSNQCCHLLDNTIIIYNAIQ